MVKEKTITKANSGENPLLNYSQLSLWGVLPYLLMPIIAHQLEFGYFFRQVYSHQHRKKISVIMTHLELNDTVH